MGRAIFPTVDAGQFTLRMRATAGTRIEETEKLANKTLDIVRREVGPQNVALTLGFVGVQNAAYPNHHLSLDERAGRSGYAGTGRRLDGHNQLPKITLGVRFTDGIEVVKPKAQAAAA